MEWKVPAPLQPVARRYGFDLERALSAVVGLSSVVPAGAFTAETLGTERAGNAVLVRDDGIVLTIGYLITEASAVWLTTGDGRVVEGHPLGIDPQSGLGLVQALRPLGIPSLPMSRSAAATPGDEVVVAGAGGRRRSVAARIATRRPFAGYWEYLLEDAIFTAPVHPHWGGAALIGAAGDLLGIGSLQLQGEAIAGQAGHMNMIVPIDLLRPVMDDILRIGRPDRPPRPWLGLFATDVEGQVVVAGTATGGPAEKAGLQIGDIVLSVAGQGPGDLAGFFRRVWSLGEAGISVPLQIGREGRRRDVALVSVDRAAMLIKPVLH